AVASLMACTLLSVALAGPRARAQPTSPLFNIPVTPGGAEASALGDFNEDGKPDVVGLYAGSVRGFLNTGAGKFVPGTPATPEQDLVGLVVADVNNDTHDDVVTANYFSDSVTVLLGDGHGNLQLHATITGVGFALDIVALDLNADGKLDLATTTGFGYKVTL